MSKFLLNLLPPFSKALVNSKIQFLIRIFFSFTFDLPAHAATRPIRPLGSRGHPSFFLLALAERRLSLLSRHRTMGVAPLLPPHARKPQRSPPHNPIFNQPQLQPPSLPVMAAMKAAITAAACGFRPPPPPSWPYKRTPTLRWSTSLPHPSSSPPQSRPRRSHLEPKLRRRCAASSPSSELG
jgi:hypothetical protein